MLCLFGVTSLKKGASFPARKLSGDWGPHTGAGPSPFTQRISFSWAGLAQVLGSQKCRQRRSQPEAPQTYMQQEGPAIPLSSSYEQPRTGFLCLAFQGSNIQGFLNHSETQNAFSPLKSISRSYFLLELKPCLDENLIKRRRYLCQWGVGEQVLGIRLSL